MSDLTNLNLRQAVMLPKLKHFGIKNNTFMGTWVSDEDNSLDLTSFCRACMGGRVIFAQPVNIWTFSYSN